MREELTNLRRFYGDHVPTLLEARHEYAVLCPLVERPDGLHLLFEVRSAGVSQSGETCFPGGQMEPGETPADCALRETEEELVRWYDRDDHQRFDVCADDHCQRYQAAAGSGLPCRSRSPASRPR